MRPAVAAHTRHSWRHRGTRAAAPRAHAACRVVGLLASHVSSSRRLDLLRQCLRSIALQSTLPDALYLSWYASERLADEVVAALRAARLPCLRSLRQSRRLSQYEHLEAALTQVESDGVAQPVWAFFSDDDDLWHPHRTRQVRAACATASERVASLAFPHYAYPLRDEGVGGGEGSTEASTARGVDELFTARAAAIWLGPSEVFQLVVRPSLLRAFFDAEPPAVIHHRFADVRFAQYVRKQSAESALDVAATALMPAPAARTERGRQAWLVDNWWYFYRHARQAGGATSFLGDLDEMHEHVSAQQPDARAGGQRGGSGATEGGYERASTGRHVGAADREAARKVLAALDRALCVAPSQPARARGGRGRGSRGAADATPLSAPESSAEEIAEVAGEIGRRRHHAELSVLLCLHFSNAAELALAICGSERKARRPAESAAEQALNALLDSEEERLVHEACAAFAGGAERRLPRGTLEQALA